MKRILYIAYHFPPHGGAGVQRSLKFVKYLPAFGIEPTVLTRPTDTDHRWSPPDPSMLAEIPAGTLVVRTPWATCREPGAADSRLELAARLVADQRLEAVVVSMSPFSDARFAATLAERCRIPWIADLRDPWALDEFQVYRTGWHRADALRTMRHTLDSAALVIMNTPEAAAALVRTFPEYRRRRVVSITNGFDAEDLRPTPRSGRNAKFTIVHSGYLHTASGLRQQRRRWMYRVLRRMEPGVEILPRSHFFLLQAISRWLREDPSIAGHVQLLLAGDLRPDDRAVVTASEAASVTLFTGYLSHAESVRLVHDADLLFLPMHKIAPGRRATIVPGKTYEYLAARRPILAAVPAGDACDFLTASGAAAVCGPDDVDAMVQLLHRQFSMWRAGQSTPCASTDFLKLFERRELTRRLSSEIHALLDERLERPRSIARASAVALA